MLSCGWLSTSSGEFGKQIGKIYRDVTTLSFNVIRDTSWYACPLYFECITTLSISLIVLIFLLLSRMLGAVKGSDDPKTTYNSDIFVPSLKQWAALGNIHKYMVERI